MSVYSYENLKKLTQTKNGEQFINAFKKYYNKNYKNLPIYSLPFSAFKLFYSVGDRETYEIPYFQRRDRLNVLQVLAINDDKYIEELEEIMATICDEFTWVLHAHAPNYEVDVIDLFSSTTARILAETLFVFGDKLSKAIQVRVKESINQKIIRLYEKRTFWWEDSLYNWAAVCSCGVGLSYLYLYPERFEEVKERLFKTFKGFLLGFGSEGYCGEGVNYWQFGFSHFCIFFNCYEKLTNIRPEFIDSEGVKNILRYIKNAKLSKDIYLPFADGGFPTWKMRAATAYVIKSLYPNHFTFDNITDFLPDHQGNGIRNLYGVNNFEPTIEKQQKEESIYYHTAQVFIRKRENYSFTAQCGHNGVDHNHNDVGSFQIVKNNQRVICDFGVGAYVRQYFDSNERYKIFACNSLSHSIPIVDGKLQSYGTKYCGKVLSQDKNSITMDIAKAYENAPLNLIVEYRTEKDYVSVKYNCKGIKEKICFHFVSDIKPVKNKKGVWLNNTYISNSLSLTPKITKREECIRLDFTLAKTNYKSKRKVYMLDYEVIQSGDINAEFIFHLG